MFLLLILYSSLMDEGRASTANTKVFSGSVVPEFADGLVRVASYIESDLPILAMKASVPPLQLDLKQGFPGGNEWSAQVPLEQLLHGANQAKFVATDALGFSVTNVIDYRLDLPPKVTIVSPKRDAIYTDLWVDVDVSATNEDNSIPVPIKVWGAAGAEPSLVGTNRVQGRLPLSANLPNSFVIQVTDPGGVDWRHHRTLFPAPNPNLVVVGSGDGMLLDFSDHRFLLGGKADIQPTRGDRVSHRAVILDLSGGSETAIELPVVLINGDRWPMAGRLTPHGALLFAYRNAFDSRDGGLLPLALEWNLVVSPDSRYAAWHAPGQYQVLYSLTSGDFVTFVDGDYIFDVAPNTDLLLGLQNGAGIQLYLNRAIDSLHPLASRQTADLGVMVAGALGHTPQTDGSSIAYSAGGLLHLRTMTTNMFVASLVSAAPTSWESRQFALREGWLAYNTSGAQGRVQVWSRSPQGETELRSFPYSSGALETLLPNGWLTFTDQQSSPAGRYLSIPGKDPLWISSEGGRVVWRDGKLYFLIHNTLFAFQPDGLNIDVTPQGGVLVTLHGTKGEHYLIQTSTDLLHWTDLKQGIMDEINIVVAATPAVHGENRFYRAISVP